MPPSASCDRKHAISMYIPATNITPQMSYAQITQCALMGKVCQYILNIWTKWHQPCDKQCCTKMTITPVSNADNNDNAAWYTIGQISQNLGQHSKSIKTLPDDNNTAENCWHIDSGQRGHSQNQYRLCTLPQSRAHQMRSSRNHDILAQVMISSVHHQMT